MQTPLETLETLIRDGEYDSECQITKTLIAWMQGALYERAINLACAGAMREWNESIPEGTVMTFDLEDLRTCGDPCVASLIELWDALEVALSLYEE